MSAQLTGMSATAVGPHLYWLASRAAGSAALLLSSASVCVGLASSMRLLKGRIADLRVMHEALSLATIAALLVHVLTLLGDGFLHLSPAELTVPFLSGYQTLWTTAGIVGFWMLLALGLSYYAPGSACSAGACCTASPRLPGCSASRTRSARGPTPARAGSSR
jgi:sulfoxide reductase heme-binding subunit YedZ